MTNVIYKLVSIHLRLTIVFFSIVSKANEMIGSMVRNSISRIANILEIYKTLIRPHREHSTQAKGPVSRRENWRVILTLEGIKRGVTKIIKGVKDYCYRAKGEPSSSSRLRSPTFLTLPERRIVDDLNETFKRIIETSNYGWYFFNIPPRSRNLLSKHISTTKSTHWIFLLI